MILETKSGYRFAIARGIGSSLRAGRSLILSRELDLEALYVGAMLPGKTCRLKAADFDRMPQYVIPLGRTALTWLAIPLFFASEELLGREEE